MAAKRNIQFELKDFLLTGFYASVTLEAMNIARIWYSNSPSSGDHMWPFLAGFGYVAFRKFLGNTPTKALKTVSSIVPTFSRDPDISSYEMRYRERVGCNHEITFRGYGLPVPIPESKFSRFVSIAWRRQMNAIHGSKLGMMWQIQNAGQPRLRQLTANQVLSARHYLKVVEPRFVETEYIACLMILEKSKLLDSRRQGRAGLLLYEPNKTVNIALNTWFAPPPQPRFNFFKKLPN